MINLGFHGVGAPERELEPDEDQYWIDPELFGELLDTALELPEVKLTFDDGNASDLSVALPMLLERGLTAAFFVIAGRLGQPGSLAADDVRALAEAGMTIGTHGMRHRPWRSLDEEGYREELDEATELLEAAAGAQHRQGGVPVRRVRPQGPAGVEAAEFRRVYSVDRRPARPDAWFQPRYVIRRGEHYAGTVRSFGSDSFSRTVVLAGKSADQTMAVSGPLVLVGFGEAYAAIETAWSLRDAGSAYSRSNGRGERPAVRRVRGVEVHEVSPPEDGVEETLDDLRRLISILDPAASDALDDASVLLSGALEDVTIAGPSGKRIDYCLDKALQVEAARAARLLVPPTAIVMLADELEVKEFPAFVKPARALYEVNGRLTRPTGSVVADEEELKRVAAEDGIRRSSSSRCSKESARASSGSSRRTASRPSAPTAGCGC